MPLRHLLVALITVAAWGMNFVFIKMSLREIPPITLGVLRFFFTAFPAILFLKKPDVNWKSLAAYGTTIFALQFGFLFSGMYLGMSAGLSSMILQVSVFFTIALSAIVFKERPSFLKVFGAAISFCGVALVSLNTSQDVNLMGLLLLLCGAFSWATGNIIAKTLGAANPLSLVVWGGLFATPPLFIFGWSVEGVEPLLKLFSYSSTTLWSLVYIVLISTHLGFSLWSWLLKRHSASTVAPFTLLVPVFGFLGSSLILGEKLEIWKLQAALLVIVGLGLNVYAARKRR